jgi:hypothetical protein
VGIDAARARDLISGKELSTSDSWFEPPANPPAEPPAESQANIPNSPNATVVPNAPDAPGAPENAGISNAAQPPLTGEMVTPSSPSAAPAPTVPWETERGFAKVAALFTTTWKILSSADPFFQALSPRGRGHFSYAWLLVVFTGYVQLLYEAFFLAMQRTILGGLEPNAVPAFTPLSFLLMCGILLPAFVAIGLLLEALMNHAVLLIINRAREPFSATLRAKCYATAPMILSVVPLLGPILAWVGVMLTSIVGIRRVHRIGTGAAIVAYFLPLVIWFCFLIFLGVLFFLLGSMRGTFNSLG